ncbi:hypothetical protein M0R45_009928 [Rubus argutus]|uniref:Uncharacterized protein n=1 Tax=Rubus argutus TaxID=59490 RepID=A0AAW1Y8F7_RUBAR
MVLNLKNDALELTAGNYISIDALKILKELHPSLSSPEICEQGIPSAPEYQVSQEKAKSLGVSFLPLEVSLRDTVECLNEKGFLRA